MNENVVTALDHAKNILARTDETTDRSVSIDPAVAAALAQAWALLAVAERLEELTQVTREVHHNPLTLKAVPFASQPAPIHPAPPLTPDYPLTGTVTTKKRRPVTVIHAVPQMPPARD